MCHLCTIYVPFMYHLGVIYLSFMYRLCTIYVSFCVCEINVYRFVENCKFKAKRTLKSPIGRKNCFEKLYQFVRLGIGLR